MWERRVVFRYTTWPARIGSYVQKQEYVNWNLPDSTFPGEEGKKRLHPTVWRLIVTDLHKNETQHVFLSVRAGFQKHVTLLESHMRCCLIFDAAYQNYSRWWCWDGADNVAVLYLSLQCTRCLSVCLVSLYVCIRDQFTWVSECICCSSSLSDLSECVSVNVSVCVWVQNGCGGKTTPETRVRAQLPWLRTGGENIAPFRCWWGRSMNAETRANSAPVERKRTDAYAFPIYRAPTEFLSGKFKNADSPPSASDVPFGSRWTPLGKLRL